MKARYQTLFALAVAVSLGACDSTGDPTRPDAGPSGVSDGATSSDADFSDDADLLFPCLPGGEEQLIVQIDGTPSLSLTTPDGLECLSRYLPASMGDDGLLDLGWTTADSDGVSCVARLLEFTPGRTGTAAPFALTLNHGDDSWVATPEKCRITVESSEKIDRPSTPATEIYKVKGSVACDAGWAQGDDSAVLRTFVFTTRVTISS